MLQAVDRYERDGTLIQIAGGRSAGVGHTRGPDGYGRHTAMHGDQSDARIIEATRRRPILARAGLMWLKMRLIHGQLMLSAEELARAARSLLWLRWWAMFAVEAKVAEPLASLVAKFEELERDSQSLFVHQELQFARGCLAFVRGDLKAARSLIEPLAEKLGSAAPLPRLGPSNEAQRMWPEAAPSTRLS